MITVIAARKLFNWAVAENDAGNPFPIHGTCLGFQLLHILVSNVSRNELLIETDSVSHATTLQLPAAAESSRMFGHMAVRPCWGGWNSCSRLGKESQVCFCYLR